jgi:hypothetical protein
VVALLQQLQVLDLVCPKSYPYRGELAGLASTSLRELHVVNSVFEETQDGPQEQLLVDALLRGEHSLQDVTISVLKGGNIPGKFGNIGERYRERSKLPKRERSHIKEKMYIIE